MTTKKKNQTMKYVIRNKDFIDDFELTETQKELWKKFSEIECLGPDKIKEALNEVKDKYNKEDIKNTLGTKSQQHLNSQIDLALTYSDLYYAL